MPRHGKHYGAIVIVLVGLVALPGGGQAQQQEITGKDGAPMVLVPAGELTMEGTLEDGKSPYGIYDMAGNAWEWVSDWYDNVYYKNSPSQNPKGPERGDFKVLRGGSWHSRPESLHSANRSYSPPEHHQSHDNGFRCAKTP